MKKVLATMLLILTAMVLVYADSNKVWYTTDAGLLFHPTEDYIVTINGVEYNYNSMCSKTGKDSTASVIFYPDYELFEIMLDNIPVRGTPKTIQWCKDLTKLPAIGFVDMSIATTVPMDGGVMIASLDYWKAYGFFLGEKFYDIVVTFTSGDTIQMRVNCTNFSKYYDSLITSR